MTKEVKEFVVQKTGEMMAAASCSEHAKEAAKKWLASLGTDSEKEQTEVYVRNLELDIMPIDGLIEFASSEKGQEIFGKEMAVHVAEHGREIKEKGARYCDCAACAAVEAILDKKEEIL